MLDPNNNYRLKLFFVTIFSIAMGLFESGLVIYLQELYYPDVFTFPLKQIPAHILNFDSFRKYLSKYDENGKTLDLLNRLMIEKGISGE